MSRTTCESEETTTALKQRDSFRTQGSFSVARQSEIGLKSVDFFDSIHAHCRLLSAVAALQRIRLVTTYVAEYKVLGGLT
jgi:hypothetical protein